MNLICIKHTLLTRNVGLSETIEIETSTCLTIGKSYEDVMLTRHPDLIQSENWILIDDKNEAQWYPKYLFATKEDYRELQINKLVD